MPQPERSTDEVLNCIDRGLETFGQNVGKVVYYRMNKESGLQRNEIIANPSLFISFLERMFGAYTAKVEKVLSYEIRLRFPAVRGSSLQEVINDAKRLIHSSEA